VAQPCPRNIINQCLPVWHLEYDPLFTKTSFYGYFTEKFNIFMDLDKLLVLIETFTTHNCI